MSSAVQRVLKKAKERPVTSAVMLLCLICYLPNLLNFPWNPLFDLLKYPSGRDPESFLQIWRYFTPALVHFSHIHIGFNLFFWWMLASVLEQVRGSLGLFWILIVVGVISNTAQYAVGGAEFGGLSGVVYGLFGYAWIFAKIFPQSGLRVPGAIMVQILIWLLLGFSGLLDQLVGPMANMAHLGGLIVGLILGLGAAIYASDRK